mmetsp:Transcript_56158/g.99258  ORF Transcript_56158/g.99258 Transcript_56158/m.99258 type:complete len:291 (-) Transcript_56158:572-1444(-)
MLDSPRSSSPTSPVTEPEQKGWQCLYFCRFPGCNKGYASTDGVRKHCRKHHAEWLADLDNTMRENNQKHSAANYCSTQPAEGVEPPLPNSRKRPRADSGTSSIGGTPTGTPRLDPSVPPRIDAAPTPMALEEARGAPPQQEATTLLVRPVKLPVKEDTIKEEAVFACGWPSFSEDGSLGGVRAEAPDRTLLSALAALDEGSTSWPYRSTRERSEPLVDNFFSLGSVSCAHYNFEIWPPHLHSPLPFIDLCSHLCRVCLRQSAASRSPLMRWPSFSASVRTSRRRWKSSPT